MAVCLCAQVHAQVTLRSEDPGGDARPATSSPASRFTDSASAAGAWPASPRRSTGLQPSQVASIFSPRRMVARRSEDYRRQRQPEEPRRQNLQHSRDDAQACQYEGDPGEHCPESSAQGHPLRDIGNHQKSKGFSWSQSRSAPLIRETQDRPSPYEGGAPGASSRHQQNSAASERRRYTILQRVRITPRIGAPSGWGRRGGR
jgi:hypothetical protein